MNDMQGSSHGLTEELTQNFPAGIKNNDGKPQSVQPVFLHGFGASISRKGFRYNNPPPLTHLTRIIHRTLGFCFVFGTGRF
jgi:hypothetical protein